MICPVCTADNPTGVARCGSCGGGLAATPGLRTGAVIANRYQILELLGKGGMGVVFKAHDRLLDETIKVLRGDVPVTPEAAERFRGEIKLARRVTHRNVCRIHEYGEDAGLRFISMEFVDGLDRSWAGANGRSRCRSRPRQAISRARGWQRARCCPCARESLG